jgi:hypothetical protein
LTIEFTRTQQSNNLCNIERSTFDIVHACVATFISTYKEFGHEHENYSKDTQY